MQIVRAEFVKSAVKPSDYPHEPFPEVAFAGRSNVGKSSLINTLLKRKGLAKTSSVPGKTQLINFFRINDHFYFVDLPGYGYAKVPLKVKDRWRPVVETYLTHRSNLRMIVFILDIRRCPSDKDRQFMEWIRFHRIPACVVATKIDKLSRGRLRPHLEGIARELGISIDEVTPFSAVTKDGKRDLWKRIYGALK